KPAARGSVARVAAIATAAAVGVGALAFGLWAVRSIVILLLLSLTFAAAIRPGVEWLQRHRVPQPAAPFSFFFPVRAVVVLCFWAAVPPAIRETQRALDQHAGDGQTIRNSTGIKHDVLVWVERQLHQLPSGADVLHPVATYSHEATHAIVVVFFTLA